MRSISGKRRNLPDFGGHSISNSLLANAARSRSASHAKACTIFPLLWLTGRSGIIGSGGSRLVSSANSRRAAATRLSPDSTKPLGMVQAPSSFLAQNGPPGWASRTSSWFRRRKATIPALISLLRRMRAALPKSAALYRRSCQTTLSLHDFVTITPTMRVSSPELIRARRGGGKPNHFLHGSQCNAIWIYRRPCRFGGVACAGGQGRRRAEGCQGHFSDERLSGGDAAARRDLDHQPSLAEL